MVEWIVSSSVLIAVVILLRVVLKGKISLRLQYALWALVLVRLLVPVSFGDTAMSVGNLTQKAAASEPAQIVSALSETELPKMSYQAAYNEVAKEYADKGIQIEELPLEEYAETVDNEIMNKMNGDISVAEVVQIIWICGIVLVGVWFVISNLRLLRSLKESRTLLATSYTLPVYLSDAIDTPCLFGLLRPAIYLTCEAIENDHTMRHAVEHELTHYRHRDNIWAVLRSVCLAVHWYNPLVWYAAVLSRNDAELACDESTILRLGEGERAAYGRTLIRLTCEKRPALLNTATTMSNSGKNIKERIALIVKKPKMAKYTFATVLVIALFAVGCTFTGASNATDLNGEDDVHISHKLYEEYGVPEAVSCALIDFLNACKNDPESASSFCHFETTEEQESFEKSIKLNRLLSYEILTVDTLSNYLYEFELHLEKKSGEIPERSYFVGEYNGQFWVMNNIENVPESLRKNEVHELTMVQALRDATMENSTLTRIEGNVEVGVTRSSATMDVLKSATENLEVLQDPVSFASYTRGTYLWLGDPGDRHISFFAGEEPYQVKIRYVGDDINESAVTNNPQLYLFLISAAENENVELHDLDGDGFLEGIIWPVPMEPRNIVIYDVYDGALQRIDVNEAMDCTASDFTGLIANIHPDYSRMIQIVNSARDVDVYQYRDGAFSYVSPLNDLLGQGPSNEEEPTVPTDSSDNEITLESALHQAIIEYFGQGDTTNYLFETHKVLHSVESQNDTTHYGLVCFQAYDSEGTQVQELPHPMEAVVEKQGDDYVVVSFNDWFDLQSKLPSDITQEILNQTERELLAECKKIAAEHFGFPETPPAPVVENIPFTDQPIFWNSPLNGMFEHTYETQRWMMENIDKTYPFVSEQVLDFASCSVILGTTMNMDAWTPQGGTVYILFQGGGLGKLPLPLNSDGMSVRPTTVTDNGDGTLAYSVEAHGGTCHYTVDLERKTVSMSIS